MFSNSNSDSLPPIQENDFLPPISRWTTFGGLFILVALGLAIPLASVTKYKVTVKAQAVVRPAGELPIVQAATEGQVLRIFVQENQVVKKGNVIATIGNSPLQTKKSQLQSQIKEAQQQLFQINSQISAFNSQMTAKTDRIKPAAASKEQLALIQQRIAMLKQLHRDTRELQQVKTDLSRTAITATTDGIISKLNLRTPGQTVRSGEEIVQIVPSNAPFVVKAAVASEDRSNLKEGQNVHIRVSACPYPDYGTLKGKVKVISPFAIAPQGNGATVVIPTTATSQKAAVAGAFYEVTIEPESLFLGRGKKQCSIQLGMEGRADIISREETVLQFFLRKAKLIADL
jgi:multidrug efflux pump subunit AcrA (membrane-fusion protein)